MEPHVKRFLVLLRMVFSGRPLQRVKVFSQYFYYWGLETLNPDWSLERPRFHAENGPAIAPAKDRTASIEFHLVADANARKEFGQTSAERLKSVTHVDDKFRTARCFICDKDLQPVIQVVDADDTSDFIEVSWCRSCDHLQYSTMPSKAWISRWYAANYDTSGSDAEKLEQRNPTYRYYRRLLPYIGGRKLKILDIGAGYGEKIIAFKQAGHEIHCTEATTRRADYLKRNVTPNVYFGGLDDAAVREKLRRAGPFDLIFSYHVIEHIYNPRQELQILRDIAAPDAIFYLAIPELYKEGILNNVYALEHIASFSRLSAQMLMKQIGFKPIVAKDDLLQHYSNYCQYVIGRKSSAADISVPTNDDPQKMARYLTRALKLDRIAALDRPAFSYVYKWHAKLTYGVNDETKAKCRDPAAHLPVRLYHHGLPLFWMYA